MHVTALITESYLRVETLSREYRMLFTASGGMEVHNRLSCVTLSQCLRLKSRASQSTVSSSVLFRLMTYSNDLNKLDTRSLEPHLYVSLMALNVKLGLALKTWIIASIE